MNLEDPQVVVQLLVDGMLALERDPVAGEQQIVPLVAKDQLGSDGKLHDREMIKRLLASPHIARSYVGASHTTNYELPATRAVTFDRSNPHAGIDYPSPGHAKFFLACGGADSPRPIELRKNASGQWKVTSWSTLTVSVRKPAAAAGDF